MEGFAQALVRRASDREKLLARPRKLLVPDDRTGLLSSPGYVSNYLSEAIEDPVWGPERARDNSENTPRSRSANVFTISRTIKVNSYKEQKNNSYNTEKLHLGHCKMT